MSGAFVVVLSWPLSAAGWRLPDLCVLVFSAAILLMIHRSGTIFKARVKSIDVDAESILSHVDVLVCTVI